MKGEFKHNMNVNVVDIGLIVYERKLIYEHIVPVVKEVRTSLSKTWDIHNGDHKDYTGLCDEAVTEFTKKFKARIESEGIFKDASVRQFHGELAHNPSIPSQFWPLQHTWAAVEFRGITIYVDPTCQQFKSICSDIPDYYVSVIEPKWFYSDRDNPVWNGFTRFINEKVQIPRTVKDDDVGHRKVHDGIIEYFQYEVWGIISDTIRVFKA